MTQELYRSLETQICGIQIFPVLAGIKVYERFKTSEGLKESFPSTSPDINKPEDELSGNALPSKTTRRVWCRFVLFLMQ